MEHTLHSYADNNELPQSGDIVLGEQASSTNPIDIGTFCFNISSELDGLKERTELFILGLQTTDSSVCLEEHLALVKVEDSESKWI